MNIPKMTAVQSSNIAAIGHDRETSELHVQFKNGATYVYRNVGRGFYDRMLEAASPGKFHGEQIKGKFAHFKLGGHK
jgi:hypothetical protein